MNGPEHYRAAENLIDRAHDMADQGYPERADFILRRAQVHATLALVAAQVEAVASRGPGDLDPAWRPGLGWEPLT